MEKRISEVAVISSPLNPVFRPFATQTPILAFSQLTWRESLRDIEVCLAANQTKLFHMGLAQPPARSTLADALNIRDWRIYQALAQRLISRARACMPRIRCSISTLLSTRLMRPQSTCA